MQWGDRGSAMMLVPAGVLVLLVLGAIAVDSAAVFMAQRDLANRTAAAANDIAGYAVSDGGFYEDRGTVSLDQTRAASYVDLVFAADRRPGAYRSWGAQATTDGRRVVVAATADVGLIFAPAVPGVAHWTTVRATSTATAIGG